MPVIRDVKFENERNVHGDRNGVQQEDMNKQVPVLNQRY